MWSIVSCVPFLMRAGPALQKLAREINVVYHREHGSLSIIPHQPLSLLRQEDKMQLRFPGIVICGLLPQMLAESQLGHPPPQCEMWTKRAVVD